MQSGKVLSLLSHSAENARVCLCVFQCDKNVEKHLKEVEWLESCGQDVCQISCCVFLVLSSSAQGPLMLRLYVFACVKENCICVTHEMATIYLFMHFKCVFPPSCCKLFVGLCFVCVCVCNLQPQCQRTWPCWVACGKPPSCAAPSPISFFWPLFIFFIRSHADLNTLSHLHTFTITCKGYCITKNNYVTVWVSKIAAILGMCIYRRWFVVTETNCIAVDRGWSSCIVVLQNQLEMFNAAWAWAAD